MVAALGCCEGESEVVHIVVLLLIGDGRKLCPLRVAHRLGLDGGDPRCILENFDALISADAFPSGLAAPRGHMCVDAAGQARAERERRGLDLWTVGESRGM